jgi:hypothetical protein
MKVGIYSLLISLLFLSPVKASVASDFDVVSYRAYVSKVKDDIKYATSDGQFDVVECADGMSIKRRTQFISYFRKEGFTVEEQTDGTYLDICESKLIKISW